MQQRIVAASAVGMLAAFIAMAAFMRTMLEKQQQIANQQQAQFEAMLSRIPSPAKMFGTLSIAVNRPIRGSFGISGGNLSKPTYGVLTQSSDPNAATIYDFGELSPGIYDLEAVNDTWFVREKFVIRSGDSRCETFYIPEATEPVMITFTSNLPSYLSIPIDFAPNKKTIEGREWTRNYLSGFYLNSTSSRAGADEAGKVPLKLIYRPDIADGMQKFCAVIGPVENKESKGDKENCLTHVIELDLKPGQNDCHVEIPEEWLRQVTARISVPASAYAPLAAPTTAR